MAICVTVPSILGRVLLQHAALRTRKRADHAALLLSTDRSAFVAAQYLVDGLTWLLHTRRSGLQQRLLRRDLHLNEVGFGRLRLRQRDRQHAEVVGRLDLVGIDRGGQRERPLEGAMVAGAYKCTVLVKYTSTLVNIV